MKKAISIFLAMAMLLCLCSCRNVSDNVYSSSETTSQLQSSIESILDENSSANQSEQTVDSSALENTSSKENVSSTPDNTTSSEIPKATKPYEGKLPTMSANNIPQFPNRKFDLSGFWAPYEITEESFKQYKDAGFTTLAMINHSLSNSSENQFYLGSKRTMKALEICRKVGLNAILNYNDWKAEQCEGSRYNGATPFSKYDLYSDYKDIITGIHICDEPYVKHIDIYGNKTLVDDFKAVYPNAKYIVNLIPYTAVSSRGFESYDQMMEIYEQNFMEPFQNPFVSVDVYPFHEGSGLDDGTLALNYEYIAKSAKKYGVKPGFILQSSVGGGEFESELSEGDLRWEINAALGFGADTLQYYCYSVPKTFLNTGTVSCMYDYCILNRDDTPSPIYYHLQKLHKEIQSFSNVILAYDWNETIGIMGEGEYVGRVSNIIYDSDFNVKTFSNPKHYVAATTTQEMIVSHFTNDKYGEAYMFVNFADRKSNSAKVTFRDCKSIAIYSSKNGLTPKIVNLDKNGQVTLDFEYGDGLFVIPLI